jgi:hypothetical protein
MPNMDGTGPRFIGRRCGCGHGRRFGAGGRNGGHGMSYCRFASAGDKKSLMSLKAILEQRLACVDKRLQQN